MVKDYNDTIKVAFLGDSITEFGWIFPDGYVRQLLNKWNEQGYKIKIIPAGHRGDTSKDMLERMDKDVLSKKPDIMFLMCGINDIWLDSTSVDFYKKNLKEILDKAEKQNIRIILMTITPITEDLTTPKNAEVDKFNGFLKKYSKERNIQLIDISSVFKEYLSKNSSPGGLFWEDQVHMANGGNTLIADTILKNFKFEN